jgi:hypothetical protein
VKGLLDKVLSPYFVLGIAELTFISRYNRI